MKFIKTYFLFIFFVSCFVVVVVVVAVVFFYFCLLFELYEYNQRRSVIFTIETTQIDGFVF